LLHQLRAQAAAEAVQIAVGMRLRKACPGCNTLRLAVTGNQLVAKHDCRVLALLLVAKADPMPFVVVHERQVDRTGEGATLEFHRCAHVEQRNITQEQALEIADVVAHQWLPTAGAAMKPHTSG